MCSFPGVRIQVSRQYKIAGKLGLIPSKVFRRKMKTQQTELSGGRYFPNLMCFQRLGECNFGFFLLFQHI
jgi:hypothetical protein